MTHKSVNFMTHWGKNGNVRYQCKPLYKQQQYWFKQLTVYIYSSFINRIRKYAPMALKIVQFSWSIDAIDGSGGIFRCGFLFLFQSRNSLRACSMRVETHFTSFKISIDFWQIERESSRLIPIAIQIPWNCWRRKRCSMTLHKLKVQSLNTVQNKIELWSKQASSQHPNFESLLNLIQLIVNKKKLCSFKFFLNKVVLPTAFEIWLE